MRAGYGKQWGMLVLAVGMLVGLFLGTSGLYAQGEGLIFYVPFDGSAQAQVAAGEKAPLEAKGITFVEGRKGQAVLVTGKARLLYPAAGNLDKTKGTVCMWVCPRWDADKTKGGRVFLSDDRPWNPAEENEFRLWFYKSKERGHLRVDIRVPKEKYPMVSVLDWKAGEWHHIAATWDNKVGTTLWVDGKASATASYTWEAKPGQKIAVGGWIQGNGVTRVADAAIDELRIYNRVLSAQEMQKVMAEGK